jgi:hypothetical protein
MDSDGFAPNELLDDLGGKIASLDSDYLWRRPKAFRQLNEIVIRAQQRIES